MELFWICLTTFIASGLTLFSGFGLGTILMPVVAIFLPVPVGIAGCGSGRFVAGLYFRP
jgi:hypothetical protein